MNIHCIVTFSILLLVAQTSFVRANLWDGVYVHHRHYDDYTLPLIEVRRPKIVDVRTYDDDYTQSHQRLHVFETYEPSPPPPVIYVPKIKFTPHLFVEQHYPYVYDHYGEPIISPLLQRLHTTVTFSYKAKVLPVYDIGEDPETSKNEVAKRKIPVSQVLKTDAKESTAINESEAKSETSEGASTKGNVKVTATLGIKSESGLKPVPSAEAKPVSEGTAKEEAASNPKTEAALKQNTVAKSDAVLTPEAVPKQETEAKSESNKANESNANTDSSTNAEKNPVPADTKTEATTGKVEPSEVKAATTADVTNAR